VQYQKLTPMLLNEVQKEHKQLEEQAEKIQRQEKSVEEQQETIKQLQKRLAALEAAQPSSASELRSTTK
jgi:septal ring factor EnvC (AmiA/AmiB activator)